MLLEWTARMIQNFSAPTENRKKVLAMPDCKYCQDEVCVNADCPMCCDFCPVVDVPGVCRFEDRGDLK